MTTHRPSFLALPERATVVIIACSFAGRRPSVSRWNRSASDRVSHLFVTGRKVLLDGPGAGVSGDAALDVDRPRFRPVSAAAESPRLDPEHGEQPPHGDSVPDRQAEVLAYGVGGQLGYGVNVVAGIEVSFELCRPPDDGQEAVDVVIAALSERQAQQSELARALSLCQGLPPTPTVLDLGCGTGGQTLHLADLTGGHITAIDSHAPWIDLLRERAVEHGVADRVRGLVADMADPGLPSHSFDLIWSEGALYQVGIENALRVCRGLVRPGGYVAFSDAVWLTEDPPDEIKKTFDFDYPDMGGVAHLFATIDRVGFTLLGHFSLPDEAWMDDFYTPMGDRIEQLRGEYADDGEALDILDELAAEIVLHRAYSRYYAYEFCVLAPGA